MTERIEFGVKHPNSVEFFSFDFTSRLASSEIITGATFFITLKSGVDSNPSAMLSGPAIYTDKTTSQLVQGGIVPNTYELAVLITTSEGQSLPGCGYFTVQPC